MANSLLASVSASIPQYVADGYTGSGSTRELTFSAGAPPTDGSVGLAFIVINGTATGLSFASGAYQRLVYWADKTLGIAGVSGIAGIDAVSVNTWSFLPDANS